jgi:hypothetical protein
MCHKNALCEIEWVISFQPPADEVNSFVLSQSKDERIYF